MTNTHRAHLYYETKSAKLLTPSVLCPCSLVLFLSEIKRIPRFCYQTSCIESHGCVRRHLFRWSVVVAVDGQKRSLIETLSETSVGYAVRAEQQHALQLLLLLANLGRCKVDWGLDTWAGAPMCGLELLSSFLRALLIIRWALFFFLPIHPKTGQQHARQQDLPPTVHDRRLRYHAPRHYQGCSCHGGLVSWYL